MVLSTEWSQVEVIDLLNDGNGLGFILVGGKSTGVVIKALTPGGIAERDGRMQCGDHVLQIGDVNLRGFSSEQAACVLRQMGAQVRLIVARPVEPTSPDYQALASHAPIIPTKLLTDPEELERQLIQTAAFSGPFFSAQDAMLAAAAAAAAAAANAAAAVAQQAQAGNAAGAALPLMLQQRASLVLSPCSPLAAANLLYSPNGGTPVQLNADGNCGHSSCGGYESESSAGGCGGNGGGGGIAGASLPETECFDVVLHRNVYGLGIRVAGYVCVEEDLSGIFVKSMVEGGAGEAGRVRINDRILAVDGRSVADATNHEAVTLLKNSGISVHLRIERFLRGRKYEHLQVALNDMKEVNISATTPGSASTTPGGTAERLLTMPTTSSSAQTPSQMRQLVGSDTMQSMGGGALVSLPPSPSCATLTWVAPQTDADSLATIDIDYPDVSELNDKQIEAEFESHTTVDSDVFVVQYPTNGSSPAASTTTYSSPPTTPNSPAVSPFGEREDCPSASSPLPPPAGVPLSVSAAHMLELFPPQLPLPLPPLPTKPKQPASSSLHSSSAGGGSHRPPLISDSSEENSSDRRRHRQPQPSPQPKQKPKPKRQPSVKKTPTDPQPPPHQPPFTVEAPYTDDHIIVAQLSKLAGLGISLEGTVDVENGVEMRPHHFIRSILDESPVALDGSLRPGDEILQLNEYRLSAVSHPEVVRILKELPERVRMVCARGPLIAPSQMAEAQTRQRAEMAQQRSSSREAESPPPELMPLRRPSEASLAAHKGRLGPRRLSKAQSESSLYTVSSQMGGGDTTPDDQLVSGSGAPSVSRKRSRSWEQMSSLALWSTEVVYVQLHKAECGFGFSVLDYQDPLDMNGTVIVVRGLIPGGAAESSGQLFPGDRIVSVGGVTVQGMQLDDAVLVLKGVPAGVVQIGLCRPLPARYDDDGTEDGGGSTPT